MSNIHALKDHPRRLIEQLIRRDDPNTALEIAALLPNVLTNQVIGAANVEVRSLFTTGDEIKRFVLWSATVEFVDATQELIPDAVENPSPLDTPEKAELLSSAHLSAEHAKSTVHFIETGYWPFRPATLVQSAIWTQTFGEYDPGKAIAGYLRKVFKNNSDNPPHRPSTVTIDAKTRPLIEGALGVFARYLCRSRDDDVQRRLYRGLITACGLQKIVPDAMVWDDQDFMTLVHQSPSWLRSPLISYFVREVPSLEITTYSEEIKNTTIVIARVCGCIVLKYLGFDDWDDLKNIPEDIPKVSFCDDDTISGIVPLLLILNMELGDTDDSFIDIVRRQIYLSRWSVFGGIFPFSLRSASEIIGHIASTKYWIATCSTYQSWEYDFSVDDDPFGFAREALDPLGQRRTIPGAILRYENYRVALAAITEDHEPALARAWWAFFIASQASNYACLGLSNKQIHEVANIAKSVGIDESIVLALRFALEFAKNAKGDIRYEAVRQNFEPLLAQQPTAHNVDLRIKPKEAENFLQNAIGDTAWGKLTKASRKDLMEAEQLFAHAAQELGAGRTDWGSLISLYARVVESEIQANITPILIWAQQHDLEVPKEPTLGSCFRFIREIRKGAKSHTEAGILFKHIQEFAKFADEHSGFVETVRNRAAHGNRMQPVSGTEFIRWRAAMFEGNLFSKMQSMQVPN